MTADLNPDSFPHPMTPPLVRQLATIVATLALALMVTRQCRKPFWLLGRLIARSMNLQHAGVTDWGLSHVTVEKHFATLDVGCGGGGTIAKLAAAASEGRAYGVDYSVASVATTRRVNRQLIDSGRAGVVRGSVSSLPFRDRTCDLTASEHRELLLSAGYVDVRVLEEKSRGWICAVGRNPTS
jgi:SAM-dependent methyltransferase